MLKRLISMSDYFQDSLKNIVKFKSISHLQLFDYNIIKSMKEESVNRKSVNRKSVNEKSVNEKSVNEKSINEKYMKEKFVKEKFVTKIQKVM